MATPPAPPKPSADEPAPTKTDPDIPDPDDDTQSEVPSNVWEFIDKIPTPEEVHALLLTLPDQWGVKVADFLDYIVPLPSKKKIKVEKPGRNGQMITVDEYKNVYTLYMGVSGRIAMLNRAAEINGWRADLEPASGAGDLPPGFIEMGSDENSHIVYREQCVLFARMNDGTQEMLGAKTGTAWVKARGGQQAAGSNPYEKVETAARGRAIAAWGIGVLPGSGVASLEEMLGRPRDSDQNRGGGGRQERPVRKSRDTLIDEAKVLAEEVRQLRQIEHDAMDDKIIEFGRRSFEIECAKEGGGIDWSKWKDGHLPLLVNTLDQQRRKLQDEQSEI